MAYQVNMIYPSGEEELLDEVFENEKEAYEWGLENMSAYDLGGEILEMSNLGDYPYDEDGEGAEFEIIETHNEEA